MGYYEHLSLTRRKMIRALGLLALIPMAGLWDYMVRREQFRDEKKVSQLNITDIPMGNSYYNEYWIIRNTDGFKVFSTKCTHLGCRVRPASGDQLVCPCHGSAFSAEEGSVIRGPAEKSLQMLNFIVEEDHLTIFIK